jgi:hypothetical protein
LKVTSSINPARLWKLIARKKIQRVGDWFQKRICGDV